MLSHFNLSIENLISSPEQVPMLVEFHSFSLSMRKIPTSAQTLWKKLVLFE
jgi:hypothetical protein